MNQQFFIQRLETILNLHKDLLLKEEKDFLELREINNLYTQAIAAVESISGKQSAYYKQVIGISEVTPKIRDQLELAIGIVEALKTNLENGYLRTLSEIMHSEVFADFLEMAQHLADKNYKDPAAVLAGSTLESHLRKLAEKNNIPVTNDSGEPFSAGRINDELMKKPGGVYETLDHKNIMAWLNLRNDAAHGRHDKYSVDQVKLLISGIRDFITRNPA